MQRPVWLSAAALSGRFATIRGGLVLVVIAALLPVTLLSLVQGRIALNEARAKTEARLAATATAIAEAQREPFIIARHSLNIARQQEAVLAMSAGCNSALAAALRGATGVINFVRTDAQGRARCSVLPFTPGQNLSRDSWWKVARTNEGLSLSPPEIGTISQRPVLIMARQIKNSSGEFDGTISAGVNIARLRASLVSRTAGGGGVSAIVDRNGKVILSNTDAAIGPFPAVGSAAAVPAVAIFPGGSRWSYASAPLFSDELFAIYAESEPSLMGAAEAQWRLSLALPLLALILTSLAIWFGTHWLVIRWMTRLQRLTGRFATGDLHIRDPGFEDAPEEIARLSDDLHGMAAALRAHEADLTAALGVKTALTREIHHRVKNNLQIVTSLLTLQADRVPDPWAREMLNQAKSRIAALGLIHRLMYQDDRDNEQGRVNIRLLLPELCAQLRAAYRSRTDIALESDADDVTMPVDFAVPMTLFTVEGVTNAFRHAFPARAGRIDVRFRSDADGCLIEIADNGRGFRADSDSARMGLDLMSAFASQLEGKLEIESGDRGTRVAIRFACDPIKAGMSPIVADAS